MDVLNIMKFYDVLNSDKMKNSHSELRPRIVMWLQMLGHTRIDMSCGLTVLCTYEFDQVVENAI